MPSRKVVEALLKLFQDKPKALEQVDKLRFGRKQTPAPQSGTGPGPSPKDSIDDLQDKGFNQFQRGLIESSDIDPATAAKERIPITKVGEREARGQQVRKGKLGKESIVEDHPSTRPTIFPGEENIQKGSIDVDAPRDSVHRQHIDPKELGFDNPEVKGQMAIIETQRLKERKIIQDVAEMLNDMESDPKTTYSPSVQRDAARRAVRDGLKEVETDEAAKELFDLLGNVERGLKPLPKASTQLERQRLGEAIDKKQRFRKEARDVTAKGREERDPEGIKALSGRLVAPLKDKKDPEDSLKKILLLRAQRKAKGK